MTPMNKTVGDFLNGKSEHTVELFEYLVDEFNVIGVVTVYPGKSMIGFAAQKKFAYVIQLGKNFVDVVFPFSQAYEDNLCFNKIRQVPGTDQYNHHLRLYFKDDITKEVRKFMKLAYENANQ